MEVDGWDPSLEEELGVSLDELRKWIEEAVEKSEVVQKKRAQLTELKQLVEQKEKEEAHTELLLTDARQWAAFSRLFVVLPWVCAVCVAQADWRANSPLFLRSIKECEKLVKAAYQRNGLVYRESSSEEDGEEGCPLSPEVIEIDDEEDDDDVIAVGCGKLY